LKVLRFALKAALVLLAVVALAVGVTWSFLQTRRGGDLVRRFALPRVNAALAGRIALDRVAFGGDRLMFENLSIFDPEGRLVARVARIDVGFRPLALLRRHVDVRTWFRTSGASTSRVRWGPGSRRRPGARDRRPRPGVAVA
jgi:translocation and assembly module TamB